MSGDRVNPKKTIREWWGENSILYSSYSDAVAACSEQLGVTRRAIFNLNRRLKLKGKPSLNGKSFSNKKICSSGLSEEELRIKHDPLYKLEKAVKSLIKGQFIPEQEFRGIVGLDSSKFRAKADLPQFDLYKGKVQGAIYWGNPKDIKRLKEEGILS